MTGLFNEQIVFPDRNRSGEPEPAKVAARVFQKQGEPYIAWIIGNALAKDLGIKEGDRIAFGLSKDRGALTIAPAERGWKVTKQSRQAFSVMVKAEKLGLNDAPQRPQTRLPHIRFDNNLVIDLFHLTKDAQPCAE